MRLTGGWRLAFARYGLRALVLVDAMAVEARRPNPRQVPVKVSGTIADPQGRALEGVTVELSGTVRAKSTTRADGTYAIIGARGAETGASELRSSRDSCRFSPTVVALNPLVDEVVNFTGTGANCSGTAAAVLRNSSALDPGPRPGPPGGGGPALHDRNPAPPHAAAVACFPGLAPPMLLLCEQAFIRFQKVDSVSGAISGEEGAGLGPTFNGNSCAMCHAQPAILGSSPAPFSPQKPAPNPQLALATLDGARNTIPPFITADGPVRVVRFKTDNDVHDLYTIAGRTDARGCGQPQPDFASNLARDNLSFRIPLPLFGLGLVEALSEATLRANLAASRSSDLGVAGMFNASGNDGTITRFGRKAQDKSLLVFAAEAYNVEIGVTNELFPEERHAARGCTLNGIPEDATDPTRSGTVSDTNSDIQNFAIAIRLSAPPLPALPPGVTRASADNGRVEFENIGCSKCHAPSLTTSTSNLDPAMSRVAVHAYSDFALHHMGAGLADGIVQGFAGPDQFRTTPLWGLGQRLFFLHDGRTTDVVDAIEAHASVGSEANSVITIFNFLAANDQQDLVNFLRSL